MKSPGIALGLDLGGSSVKWGGVHIDGSIAWQGTTPIKDHSPAAVVNVLSEIILKAKARSKIAAIGIGSPGLVDKSRRIIRTSPNFPEWENVPLLDMLAPSAEDTPIVLENDANLLLFSETRWGAAVGRQDVIILTLGTGVGGGVMVNGELLHGVGGGAGELGHTPVYPDGPVCGCGATGCLEIMCNIAGVSRAAQEAYQPENPPETPAELASAAEAGDERAKKAYNKVGYYLGIGVAGLLNTFNPEIILIGGGISQAGELIFKPMRETAAQRAYTANWNEAIICQPALGNMAGMLGAAALAFEFAGIETKS